MIFFQKKQRLNQLLTNIWKLILVLLGSSLASCIADSQMHEVSNTSSAQSKKDGVFVKSYRISPASAYLPIKEVFVEQRLLEGGNPVHQRLLDSSKVATNLLVILEKPLQLGILSFDWNLVLADGVVGTERHELTPCSEQTSLLLRFRLKDRPIFDNPTFPMRLELMKDSATNVVKTVNFTATPL